MNGVDWMAARIIAAANSALAEGREEAAPRFNPRPPGVIRPDGATQAVLKFLRASPGRFFRREEIVIGTGCTDKAVDWALLYLRARGLVRAAGDTSRNSRYLRYSIAQEGEKA